MRLIILAITLSLLTGTMLAQTEPTLDPETVEARTEAISKTLRCVVCQNQSINDSNAPLAADMRTLVRKRVLAGDSDVEVREYLRVRYGDYVLMRPPFQMNTWLLWLGPLGLVAGGGLWFVWRARIVAQPADTGRQVISETDLDRVRAALDQSDADEAGS